QTSTELRKKVRFSLRTTRSNRVLRVVVLSLPVKCQSVLV
ncbi:sulfatase family protein, partial [Vibrio parahaemolyticus V-223/04]